MEEEGAAAATPADTSFWVSLELGSALISMSGLGAEGSSSWWKKEAGRTPLGPGSAGASQGDPPRPQDRGAFLKQRMLPKQEPVSPILRSYHPGRQAARREEFLKQKWTAGRKCS